MHIPVFTYHSSNISGNDYHTNDHIALRSDLNSITQLGVKIISAHNLVKWLKGELDLDLKEKYAVLTFDDGLMLDYLDWQHPKHGFQSSFYKILKEHSDDVHATSFVIASPNVRKILEQTCMGGHPIWSDDWWQAAEDSQLLSIENHSWDHLHKTLDTVFQKDNLKGDFKKITTFEEAENQIKQSSNYINSQIKNKRTTLFAYPYGDYNDYLVDNYFPHLQNEIAAAFSCEPCHVSKQSNIWKVPRYMCGLHWKSEAEFKKIILGF